MHQIATSLVLLSTLLLSACGGGSSDSAPPTPPPGPGSWSSLPDSRGGWRGAPLLRLPSSDLLLIKGFQAERFAQTGASAEFYGVVLNANHGDGLAAAVLQDGRVLVTGGLISSDVAEVFGLAWFDLKINKCHTNDHRHHSALPLARRIDACRIFPARDQALQFEVASHF